MSIDIICIVLALSSMMVGGTALTIACIALTRVIGLEKSTHQVQFVPLETEKGMPLEGEELDKNMKLAMSEERYEKEYI